MLDFFSTVRQTEEKSTRNLAAINQEQSESTKVLAATLQVDICLEEALDRVKLSGVRESKIVWLSVAICYVVT